MMRPCAGISPWGRLVIWTTTLAPSSAPCRSRNATSTAYQWPGSSGSTRPRPWPSCHMPPMRGGESPVRRIRRAIRRPRSFMPTASTSTRSLCINVAVSARASTKGAEPSSGMIRTSPLDRPRARPATRSPSPAVAKPLGPSIAWPSRTIAARRFSNASRWVLVFNPRRLASRAAVSGSGASAKCLSNSSRLAMGSA